MILSWLYQVELFGVLVNYRQNDIIMTIPSWVVWCFRGWWELENNEMSWWVGRGQGSDWCDKGTMDWMNEDKFVE